MPKSKNINLRSNLFPKPVFVLTIIPKILLSGVFGLSRIFETSSKYKKGNLGTLKFNLLTRNFSRKFIALGGINEKNFRKIKILNVHGCALLKDKKKAGKYMPAFFKNSF